MTSNFDIKSGYYYVESAPEHRIYATQSALAVGQKERHSHQISIGSEEYEVPCPQCEANRTPECSDYGAHEPSGGCKPTKSTRRFVIVNGEKIYE